MGDNLNPDQFFHGTTHPIEDMVRPANDLDKYPSEYSMGDPGDMSEGDHAFAIRNNEAYAWHAAKTFPAQNRRARVYEVEPAVDMKPGPWNKDHPDFLSHHELDDPKDYTEPSHDSDDRPQWESMVDDAENAKENHQDEWGSKTGFKVKNRIDTMPGRQGTFPSVNWNRFQDRNKTMHGADFNHPTTEHEMHGLRGHPDASAIAQATPSHLSEQQFNRDWHNDPAPHSVLREEMGRPQKQWGTLF